MIVLDHMALTDEQRKAGRGTYKEKPALAF